MTRDEQRRLKKEKTEGKKRDKYYADEFSMPPECDSICKFRPCYNKYEDKGSYTTGVGYASYHSEFYPACGTRLCHGCPQWRDTTDDQYDKLALWSFLKETMSEEKPLKQKMAFVRKIIHDMETLLNKVKKNLADSIQKPEQN